jgi:hypothetical protein
MNYYVLRHSDEKQINKKGGMGGYNRIVIHSHYECGDIYWPFSKLNTSPSHFSLCKLGRLVVASFLDKLQDNF